MKYQVICFHDTYLDAYQVPQFVKDSPEDIQENYRRAIYADPEGAYKNRAHEMEVVHLGIFDDMNGSFELTDKRKLCDLSALFPRGFISKKQGGNLNG